MGRNGVTRKGENCFNFQQLQQKIEFKKESQMGHFSTIFNGLATIFNGLAKKGRDYGNCLKPNAGSRRKPLIGTRRENAKEAVESMAKEAKKNHLILQSSGVVSIDGSNSFVSTFSKRGEKGVNQDCFIVWEEFGCQQDMLFCGIFDGHGSWGHFVAKRVRDTLPSSLLCNWQHTLAEASLDPDFDLTSVKGFNSFNIWKNCYFKACAAVDEDLRKHRKIDAFDSGTTALTIVRQGDTIFVANVGDSRAVLATISDDGILVPVQLTTDFKPNIPQEAERIVQCNGQVFCLDDEPGVHRVWLPNGHSPGLAMSRAFGDFCLKDFGLVSVPEVTQRHITTQDQFVVLATDGVWDVISNQDAVQIVSSTPDRAKAAECLVEHAKQAWKHKRKGIALDDISAVCLFFHSSVSSQ